MAWTVPPSGELGHAADRGEHARPPEPTGALYARSVTCLVDALMVPAPGELPDAPEEGDLEALATAAEIAGLAVGMRRNARELGLDRVASATARAAERLRFVSRERQNVARKAARRLTQVLGEAPVALGALASSALLYTRPEDRVSQRIELLVPRGRLAEAMGAVAKLRGVDVKCDLVRAGTPRTNRRAAEGVSRRASLPTPEGWRLPAKEDLVLLHASELEVSSPMAAFGLLADLKVIVSERDFHWETVHQRANLWGIRGQLWRAALEIRDRLGAPVAPETLARLRPTAWSRVLSVLLRR